MTKQDKIMLAAGGVRSANGVKLSKLLMRSILEGGIATMRGKGIRLTVGKTKDAKLVRLTMFIVDDRGRPLSTFMDEEVRYGDAITMFKLDQAFKIQVSS